MFLNSITLVLQEILEAALLVSALLAFTRYLAAMKPWIFAGILVGLAGAYGFGSHIATISEWFDYVGQEVCNAGLQLSAALLLCLIVVLLDKGPGTASEIRRLGILCALVVALGVTREGAEIYLYLQGAIGDPGSASSALAGGGIGIGIGISTGIILYYLLYSLCSLPSSKHRTVRTILLALIGGNMCAQAALLLTQADWLPPTLMLWDTSDLLSEHSVLGRLLYALIGYEATPSLAQAGSYLLAALVIATCGYIPKSATGNRTT